MKAVDEVYLDLIKPLTWFPTAFLLETGCLWVDALLCKKNWLDSQTQRVVVNGVKCSWQLITCGAAQGSLFADDTKVGGSVDLLESKKALKRIWTGSAKANSMMFTRPSAGFSTWVTKTSRNTHTQ